MENQSRNSYSVYAQMIQWEKAKQLAEYQKEEELKRFMTTSKSSPSRAKMINHSRIHPAKFSSTPVKKSSKTQVSTGMIWVLGWLMGVVSYWGFTQVTANFTAQTERQNSVFLENSHFKINAQTSFT